MLLARGVQGVLRVGYHEAARLGQWSLETPEDRVRGPEVEWTLNAEVVWRDEFWAEHGGTFDLKLDLGKGAWEWRGLTVSMTEKHLAISGKGKPRVVEL